jgi:hypothetical protein
MTKLIFGGDGTYWDRERKKQVKYEPATLEVGMTLANFNNKNLGVGDAIIISAWMTHKDNGAMTKLDISNNSLGSEGATAIATALSTNTTLTSLSIASNYLATFRPNVSPSQGGSKPDMSGVVAIANGIKDNGALTSLNMSANRLKGAEAGKALGDAIAANTVLKELDISGGQYDSCDVEFVQTFSVGLRDNGALSTVIMNKFPLPIQDIKTKAVLDFSGKELGQLDAIVIAALLPLNVSRAIHTHYQYYIPDVC